MNSEIMKRKGILAKQTDLKDRRQFPRYQVDVSLLARRSKDRSRAIQGRLVDISRAGISAVIAAELPLGEVLELEFALPHSASGVLVEAAIRSRDSYRYNMEFVRVPAVDQAKINQSCTVLDLLA